MQKRLELSGGTLKIMALIFMLIDHTAAIVFPPILRRYGVTYFGDISIEYMRGLLLEGTVGVIYVLYQVMRRILGRLAFPIYCFLLVEGFEKTGSRGKYAGRLLAFALISEVPFNLAFRGRLFDTSYQNVFFTLLLGLLMMWLMELIQTRAASLYLACFGCLAVFTAAALIAEFIQCDYGAHGTIAIGLLYFFRRDKIKQLIAGCVAFFWEFTAMFSFIFIGFYRGRRGIKLKYVFYIFYPAHLLILYLISRCI
ncbi:MAG: conjugal transfer protein TraX [Clostridium sp.]|nr:conjugal transfer protein TraX [Clostridium sp.]